jgi:hypothetical protein
MFWPTSDVWTSMEVPDVSPPGLGLAVARLARRPYSLRLVSLELV